MRDLRDSKESTGTGTESAHQVAEDGESTNAGTTEGGGSGDDALKLLVHALVTVTGHDKTLVLQLLGNVARAGAGNLNPGLGEESAGTEHVDDVGGGVDGVEESLLEVQGRGHVVDETGDGVQLRRAVLGLPDTEETDEEVLGEARVQHLADQEDVGRQGGLQHDGHVGGVEQADGVRTTSTTLAGGLDGDLNTEALQVDDGSEDGNGGQQVHDVGEVLSVEGLLQSALLVGAGHEQVEEGDDGTLELRATAGVDGGGGESLPHDGLADVGGNEERDTAAKTVALLQKLIEQNDNHTGNNELEDQEEDDTSTELGGRAVETGEDVDGGGTSGQDEGEELLSGLVELTVRLEVEVDIDHVGTSEELEDHTGGDDGGDTQLHQRTSVTRNDHSQPVEGIRVVGGNNAVERHLAHDEEDEEGQGGPHHLLLEGDPGLRLLNLGEERHERLDQVEKSHCRGEARVSLDRLGLNGGRGERKGRATQARGCELGLLYLRELMLAVAGGKEGEKRIGLFHPRKKRRGESSFDELGQRMPGVRWGRLLRRAGGMGWRLAIWLQAMEPQM